MLGSPPRMWGLLALARSQRPEERFTPTYVGTSQHSSYSRPSTTVHPHVCGDFALQGLDGVGDRGSPPRMWGLLRSRCRSLSCRRFTPTYVGTSSVEYDPPVIF